MESGSHVDPRNRENHSQVLREAANLQRASIGRLAESAGFFDRNNHLTRQPFDDLEVENDTVVAGVDQIQEITRELSDVNLLDKVFVD